MGKLFAPMNKVEASLDSLEASWADFLYGVRTGRRRIRAEGRSGGMRSRGLATVRRELDYHRARFDAGNHYAAWLALLYCVEENVPVPYWLGNAILTINMTVQREPNSLHDLFGMSKSLPANGKRARKSRNDVQWQGKLWSTAAWLIADAGRAGSKMDIDEAVRKARESLVGFPYEQTKATEMFNAQARIESEHNAAIHGRKKHRLK